MPHSLRTFLESIDNRMLHIREPVDPARQVGYLCSESSGPLTFHNLTGYPGWRLTDILIKDRNGQAAAFGLDDPKGVCPYLAERMATQRGKSVMVADRAGQGKQDAGQGGEPPQAADPAAFGRRRRALSRLRAHHHQGSRDRYQERIHHPDDGDRRPAEGDLLDGGQAQTTRITSNTSPRTSRCRWHSRSACTRSTRSCPTGRDGTRISTSSNTVPASSARTSRW